MEEKQITTLNPALYKPVNGRARRKKARAKRQERALARSNNFRGMMSDTFRLRIATTLVSYDASGNLIATTVSFGTGGLTTDSAAFLASFQKFRLWKAIAEVQGVGVTPGAARCYWQEASLGPTNDTDVPYRIVPTNSGSPRSHAVMEFVAADYPDLEFVDKGTSFNLAKFIVTTPISTLTGTASSKALIVDGWLYFDGKMFN